MVGLDMGSTSYLSRSKGAYRAKSGSSGASDKDMSGKLRRPKIRRPTKFSDYGLKRIPDYTELAYKEAVSKLRYFLSGNYVSNVRRYGGTASIKNLDDSDGDLEKKYNLATSGYNSAMLEFKPRPLTAKYATLYADSLNNTYTPQHSVSKAPAVPTPATKAADLTGETSPDVINFIQKQEEYIEQLERESQYCRDELNNLLGKVKEVISENEHLHEVQKNKLISRMFTSYAGSETDELDDLGDSTGFDSDNKATSSKTQKNKCRSSKMEGPNIMFESRIAELEAQLAQSKINLKKLQEENNENKRKFASGLVDSTCLDGFKRQIDNLQTDKSTLEAQISKLKLSLESRDGDYRRRGNDVIENQLRDERNNLEAEVRRIKDDLAKERSKVRELAGEGSRRAIQERSAAEQRYNAHFDELQHDLAVQYDNVAKLQLELERQRREENDLKREVSMKNAVIEELKMDLKNKTASLQADLAQAYAEKASLEEELASARLTIERHQRQSKHESNRLNSEIQSLRQRLDRADADLVHSRRENLRLSEQISNLEKELNMRNLTPISPQKKKEKELSTMVESLENKHAKTVAELESMIQSQNSLMEKLTGECRLLTDKLDDANRRHKQELGTLQRQVETLSRNLQAPREAPSTYQALPSHQAETSRNFPQSSGTRQEYPRADASGDSSLRRQPITDVRQNDLPIEKSLNENQPIATPQRTLSRQNSRSGLSRPESRLGLSRQGSKASIHQPDLSRQGSKASIHQPDSPLNYLEAETKDVELKDEDEKSELGQYDQSYNQNYEQPKEDNNFKTEAESFGQNNVVNEQYETPHPAEGPYEPNQITEHEYQGQPEEYQTQGYDQQQYDQQGYTENQYENYEQYPQQYSDPNASHYSDPNIQQYTDPNAHYEGNYDNYATDGTGRDYDNTQYNQDYAPEYQQPHVTETVADTKRSNTPNEKLASQS